jgi:hypothetical protein
MPVPPFIDLRGASGAVYRFRLAPLSTLPPSAGNFVCVAGEAPQLHVVACGATLVLERAANVWAQAVNQHGATGLYVRLNIAASTRASEHHDLVSALDPPLVAVDPD